MSTTEVKHWECPKCGRIIESIYSAQFDYNVALHKEKHDGIVNHEGRRRAR